MGCRMPEMGDYEAASKIRVLLSDNQNVPIIVRTAQIEIWNELFCACKFR
jgi:CheY-like chemotaxis protein